MLRLQTNQDCYVSIKPNSNWNASTTLRKKNGFDVIASQFGDLRRLFHGQQLLVNRQKWPSGAMETSIQNGSRSKTKLVALLPPAAIPVLLWPPIVQQPESNAGLRPCKPVLLQKKPAANGLAFDLHIKLQLWPGWTQS